MQSIVLVHGLWMNGMDMSLLRARLDRAGYATHRFVYSTTGSSPAENAFELNEFARNVRAASVHFVCHSLGGILVRHLFHGYPGQAPGRVVTLGTPHQPSSAAARLRGWPGGSRLLGRSLDKGLLGPLPPWPRERELGSIAGTLRFGLGTVIPGVPLPNDGTVAVQETRFPEMTDHITLPATHFGLLLSRRVFDQTLHFLQHGRFSIVGR